MSSDDPPEPADRPGPEDTIEALREKARRFINAVEGQILSGR